MAERQNAKKRHKWLLPAAVLLLLGSLLGGIPFLGFLITLVCWLAYIALIVVCMVFRVRLMHAAYQGIKFTVPVVGAKLEQLLNRS